MFLKLYDELAPALQHRYQNERCFANKEKVGKAMEEAVDNHVCKTIKHIFIYKVVILEVFHREI